MAAGRFQLGSDRGLDFHRGQDLLQPSEYSFAVHRSDSVSGAVGFDSEHELVAGAVLEQVIVLGVNLKWRVFYRLVDLGELHPTDLRFGTLPVAVRWRRERRFSRVDCRFTQAELLALLA